MLSEKDFENLQHACYVEDMSRFMPSMVDADFSGMHIELTLLCFSFSS
jgi:hypothetical protein